MATELKLPPLTIGLLREALIWGAKFDSINAKLDDGTYDEARDGRLMDIIVMPWRKRLGDCTAREVGAAGEWHKMVADFTGNRTFDQIVEDHFRQWSDAILLDPTAEAPGEAA